MRLRLRVVYSPKLECFGVRNMQLWKLVPVYNFQNGQDWLVCKGQLVHQVN